MVAKKANFRLGNLNVRSLVAHYPDVSGVISGNAFDVFCITESWLKPNISSSLIEIQGYKLLRADRLGRAGGGVAMYIRSEYNIEEYNLINNGIMLEKILVGFKFKKTTLLVGVVYRPPYMPSSGICGRV